MPLSIACPHCQAKLNAPDALAGKKIKCPKCGQLGAVPKTPESPQTPWYVKLADGADFGPVPRTELDEWFREGRITEDCQVLKEGSDQWQWATEIYPSLAPQKPVTRTAPQPKAPLPPLDDLETLPPYVEPEPINAFAVDYPLQPLSPSANAVHSLPPAPDGAPTLIPAEFDTAEETTLQRIGWFVAILPLVFACLEMADGWGINNFRLSPLLGFPLVMLAGILGGAMVGGRYFLPGAVGGLFANLGAAIATLLMLNQVNWTSNVILAIVGMIGAAPGFGVFFGLRWLQDLIFPRKT